MVLGHGMVHGEICLILHRLEADVVRSVSLLRRQRRQRNAAAADHSSTHSVEQISANRADIEISPNHIS